jgi:4-hydroxybenzoate polyprenyltransferase
MAIFYGFLSNFQFTRQYLLLSDNQELLSYTPTLMTKLGFGDASFVLLMLSVILIAASGNIINDYFDVKADRVNKPNRLIIDKYIKRRWAIILNWTFNGIGILISFYLSWQLSNFWILIIAFVSINLLYFYSAVYKRKFLSGNVIVAFLTSIVPFYVFVYAAFSDFDASSPFSNQDTIFIWETLIVIAVYCAFAFLVNFIREIVKDMADVKGDLKLQSKTIPIRFGFKRTKGILLALYLLALAPIVFFVSVGSKVGPLSPQSHFGSKVFTVLLISVILSLLISFLFIIKSNRRKNYLMASNTLKFALLFGVISALFYA